MKKTARKVVIMPKDWFFSDGKSICHFRVAGVLIKGDKVFLQKVKDEYAFPGGHVSFGETSVNTLIREFKEEIGVDILCERLLWVEENFWNWGSKKAHNISFYYLVSLADNNDLPDDFTEVSKDNSDVSLQWVSIPDIQELTVYPDFAKDKLSNLSSYVEHFVRDAWRDS